MRSRPGHSCGPGRRDHGKIPAKGQEARSAQSQAIRFAIPDFAERRRDAYVISADHRQSGSGPLAIETERDNEFPQSLNVENLNPSKIIGYVR
jgi:hypothetical protein